MNVLVEYVKGSNLILFFYHAEKVVFVVVYFAIIWPRIKCPTKHKQMSTVSPFHGRVCVFVCVCLSLCVHGCVSVCVSVCVFFLWVFVYVFDSVCLSLCETEWECLFLGWVYLSLGLGVCLSLCLGSFFYMSVCLSVRYEPAEVWMGLFSYTWILLVLLHYENNDASHTHTYTHRHTHTYTHRHTHTHVHTQTHTQTHTHTKTGR